MDIQFVLAVIKEIEQRAETKRIGIMSGNLSYDEYKTATATYQAHMQDVAIIKELAKKAQSDE